MAERGKIFAEKIEKSRRIRFPGPRRALEYSLLCFVLLGILTIDSGRAWLAEQEADAWLRQEVRFQALSDKLQKDGDNLLEVNSVVATTMANLQEIRSEQASLSDQLSVLDRMAEQNEGEIAVIEEQIEWKTAEIEAREKQMQEMGTEVTIMKEVLKEYVRTLYDESNKTTLELFLSAETFAEAVMALRDVELVEAEGQKVFEQIRNLYGIMEREKGEILTDTNRLELLKKEALRRQKDIILTKMARENLLGLTENSEKQFSLLLEIARDHQQKLSRTIDELTSELALEKREVVEELRKQAEYNRMLGLDMGLSWPVDPRQGISAYFEDPSYKDYFGVTHHAIDIRVPQGTDIYAPAYGYVYKTYMNGTDYAYVLLAHADNTFSLYGHVSEISVQEGEMVDKGQIIAKSGGMPGTVGAGWMTSGPHLHFEIHKNGEKIDPLMMLPLSPLPRNSIPKEFLSRYQTQIQALTKYNDK